MSSSCSTDSHLLQEKNTKFIIPTMCLSMYTCTHMYLMHKLSYFYHLLSFIHIVELVQTIPANNALVCPGRTLQYTCTSTSNFRQIAWQFADQPSAVVLNEDTPTATYNNYTYEIDLVTETQLITTATNKMISSDEDSKMLYCIGLTMTTGVTIDIAGR